MLKTPPRGLRDFLAFLPDGLHCLNPSSAVVPLEQFSFCAKYGVVKQRIISNASRLELLTHFGVFHKRWIVYITTSITVIVVICPCYAMKHLCMPQGSDGSIPEECKSHMISDDSRTEETVSC